MNEFEQVCYLSIVQKQPWRSVTRGNQRIANVGPGMGKNPHLCGALVQDNLAIVEPEWRSRHCSHPKSARQVGSERCKPSFPSHHTNTARGFVGHSIRALCLGLHRQHGVSN